jgi:hypothetical protein
MKEKRKKYKRKGMKRNEERENVVDDEEGEEQ